MQLNPLLTFDRYVPSSPRAPVPAACRALAADTHGQAAYLWLYGPPGVGKTHLLHAIGHAATARHPSARVAAVTATRLGEELVEALRGDVLAAWRHRYAALDILLVDDLHVVADRHASRQEIGALFARCLAGGGRVACAMTCGPKKASRVAAWLAVPGGGRLLGLRALSDRHLGRVVGQAARERGLDIAPAVVQQIAEDSGGDARTALGGLARWQLRQGIDRVRQ